jgi:hypothetical protein
MKEEARLTLLALKEMNGEIGVVAELMCNDD